VTRRADRLFQLVQELRRRPVVTAAFLARELEVSERTIYRDIQDLMSTGVPIDGEAGVGYTLRRGYDLPPLMFTEGEIEAIVLGMRFVASWGDPALSKAAGSALGRIEAAVPDRLRERVRDTRLFAPGFRVPAGSVAQLGAIRAAIGESRKLRMDYRDAMGDRTTRVVRPLGLFFWGSSWSLEGWCELRDDFRSFRLDRVIGLEVLDERFQNEPGKAIDDFFRLMGSE
jgi:predicted DNA-binding transcriptional regulator YafY